MRKRRFSPTIFAVLSLLVLVAPLRADPKAEWRQWRGPNLDGSSPAKDLPDKFDESTGVRWSTALPGPSSATPIVTGDRVFVSALDKTSKKLLAMCLSLNDGKILWQKEVGVGFQQNERNNMAAPSPVTDGKTVWFYYASGDLVAFDLDGQQLWACNIVKDHGPFNFMWIYGSSPLLHNGKLYIQVLHRDQPYGNPLGGSGPSPAPSYLLALDPATGNELFKSDRPDESVEESKESYGTPIPFEHNGKTLILLIGGDVVTAHDAETGKEIWRCGDWNPGKVGHWRVVPSVVTGAGLVFACPPKGGKIFAINPPDGSTAAGDVTATHIAWKSGDAESDVCVPLFYQGKLYVLNGDGDKTLSRVDPATGTTEQTVKLGGGPVFRASPTGADGKIYCMNEQGQMWVVSVDKLEVIHQADLGGDDGASRSSPAVIDGHLLIRTADTIYCFGK